MPAIITNIAQNIGDTCDLASFTSLNHTIHRYGIVILWEEVSNVTQLAYLFPTLVVHFIGVSRRDSNDVVVCYVFYLPFALVNLGQSIEQFEA